MIPLVFAGNRGWLHLPTGNKADRDGIVFFSAYGVEDLATRQSLLRLSIQLSEAGHPVLRFDLPGTGDSLGEWSDAASIPAWIEAGQQAVDALRRWSGTKPVSLLGLRLGGLIASLVAQSLRADGVSIRSLALLAPILDGRQHMREWRALSDGSSPLTIAGFPISEELRQAINVVHPDQFAEPLAQRIFLAVPGTAKYLPGLEAVWRTHTPVCSVPYPDLAEHIGNPTMSRAPVAMFERLLAWFDDDLPLPNEDAAPRATAALPTSDQTPLVGAHFIEEGEALDIAQGLAGVWCSASRAPARTIVVFCNAGRNPHVGWARSSVSLARHLAEHGVTSLRFDLTGLGDSPPMANQPSELLYSKAGIPQLKAVIDVIAKRHGPTIRICLVGACSGGYLAFHEALDDERIDGLVLVNVQRFIWQEGTSLQATMRASGKSTRIYFREAFAPATWKRLFGGRIDLATIARTLLQRAMSGAVQRAGSLNKNLRRVLMMACGQTPAPIDDSRRAIRQGFAALAKRHTKTIVIYGEEDGGRDEFARYFGADSSRFTTLPGARLVIIPDTDHDLTPVRAREQLFAEILAACGMEAVR